MYKIGEFSRICKASVKTLRYYDDLGILKPDFIDAFSGYRYYNASKLSDFNKISALKAMNFSLDEIKAYLESDNSLSLMELIEKKKSELSVISAQIHRQINLLDDLAKKINREDIHMIGDIIVNQNLNFKLATIRGLFNNRNEVTDKLNEIKDFFNNNNVELNNPYIIINHDTEYCKRDMDLEIGFTFNGKLPKNNFIKERIITNTDDTACIVCSNTEQEIEKAYSSLLEYSDNNMYQVIGSFYEIYYDEGIVEIRLPVHKKSEKCSARKDDIKIPFENDDEVIGKWELVDVLPSKEQFCTKKHKFNGHTWLNELYFMPEGTPYWAFGWSKSYLTNFSLSTLNKYTIENIDGEKYMFIEMKINDYVFHNGKPEIYVFKQVDTKEYTRDDIGIWDKLDYPFINDDTVLGKWKVIGNTSTFDSFDPYKNYPDVDNYWIQKINFMNNGVFFLQYKGRGLSASPIVTWTKGRIMDRDMKTSPAYEIKHIDGCDYLFLEVKTGDYIFGKMKPHYFVFRRDDNDSLELNDSYKIKKLAFDKDIRERMKCTEAEKQGLNDLINLLLKMVDAARKNGYFYFKSFKGKSDFLDEVIDNIIEKSPAEMINIMLPKLLSSNLKGKEFTERFLILDALYSVTRFGWSGKVVEEFIYSYL